MAVSRRPPSSSTAAFLVIRCPYPSLSSVVVLIIRRRDHPSSSFLSSAVLVVCHPYPLSSSIIIVCRRRPCRGHLLSSSNVVVVVVHTGIGSGGYAGDWTTSSLVVMTSRLIWCWCFAEAAVSKWKDVALYKNTSQSTQKDNSSLAEFAVDNNLTTCSRTTNQRNAQWTVHFNQTRVISQLRINTSECLLNHLLDHCVK